MKKWMRTCLSIFLALLGVIVLGIAVLAVSLWRQNRVIPVNLDGGDGIVQATRITQIATSPALPGVMLAGVSQYGGSVMYSLDGGVTWKSFSSTPWSANYTPYTVAVALGSGGNGVRLLVAGRQNGNGVFHISAGSPYWSKTGIPACPKNFTREYFSDLTISPVDPKRVYFVRYCDDLPDDMHYGEAVRTLMYEGYASLDGGLSFHRIYEKTTHFDSPVLYYRLDLAGPLLPAPVDPDHIYLGTELVSTDGGENWVATNFPVDQLVLDGAEDDRLYGIAREIGKDDIGYTRMRSVTGWKVWDTQPCASITQLVAHPTQAGVLFMRCGSKNDLDATRYLPDHRLLVSTDSGDHWRIVANWAGSWIGPDYGTPGRMLWARDDGLWATDDLGDHWTQLTSDYRTHPEKREWENITPPQALLDSQLEVIAPDDIWAGDMWAGLMHWDGRAWNKVSYPELVPPRSTNYISIFDLAFTSSDNGWMVVGTSFNRPDNHLGVVYHWDGISWKRSSPDYAEMLYGLAALGDQAWAVGEKGLIVHWDGSQWSEMESPLYLESNNTATGQSLKAITMISPEEGWAVGGNPYQNAAGVILHYRQGEWVVEYDTGKDAAEFESVSMVSPEFGWAGGRKSWDPKGMLLRWDGKNWEEVKGLEVSVTAVEAVSEKDAWAGGYNLLHWNGSSWMEVDLPISSLTDISMLPNGDLWLTSQLKGSTNDNSILRHRQGSQPDR